MRYSKFEMVLRQSKVYESKYEYKVSGPHDVRAFAVDILGVNEYPEEHLFAISVSAKGDVIGVCEVSKGGIAGSMAEPRDVFKTAIMQNAAGIILIHNHPSGDVTPSREDIGTTERLKKAGEILGIQVLDHLIVALSGASTSFKEDGRM